MRVAFGPLGGKLIAAGIAISTLGFLSQSMLTGPRLYYAMAADGAFFKSVAYVDPRTRVPVVAIVLQGLVAIAIAWSGSYEQILSYVVASDWLFFALAASCCWRCGGSTASAARTRRRSTARVTRHDHRVRRDRAGGGGEHDLPLPGQQRHRHPHPARRRAGVVAVDAGEPAAGGAGGGACAAGAAGCGAAGADAQA
jgi:hypothetical protein